MVLPIGTFLIAVQLIFTITLILHLQSYTLSFLIIGYNIVHDCKSPLSCTRLCSILALNLFFTIPLFYLFHCLSARLDVSLPILANKGTDLNANNLICIRIKKDAYRGQRLINT